MSDLSNFTIAMEQLLDLWDLSLDFGLLLCRLLCQLVRKRRMALYILFEVALDFTWIFCKYFLGNDHYKQAFVQILTAKVSQEPNNNLDVRSDDYNSSFIDVITWNFSWM
jgi:hypothetical protein